MDLLGALSYFAPLDALLVLFHWRSLFVAKLSNDVSFIWHAATLLSCSAFLVITSAGFFFGRKRLPQTGAAPVEGKKVPKYTVGLPIVGPMLAFGAAPEKVLWEAHRKYEGTPFEVDLVLQRFTYLGLRPESVK
jgi:hypothetical protein